MSYPPVHRLDLFTDPEGLAPRYRSRVAMPEYAKLDLPVTDRLAAQTLWFKTSALMGDQSDCADLVTAVAKVQTHAHELDHG